MLKINVGNRGLQYILLSASAVELIGFDLYIIKNEHSILIITQSHHLRISSLFVASFLELLQKS